MNRKSLLTLLVVEVLASWAVPSLAADNPQQQRMTECNTKAAGVTGDARQKFMSSCLSNKPTEGHPNEHVENADTRQASNIAHKRAAAP
jgi:psiF repeat